MDIMSVLTSFLALLFVLALIGFVSFLIRKYGVERVPGVKSSVEKRLSIKETKVIDAKHKMVLVSRDGVEHLLVVGGDNVAVIEADIKRGESEKK